MRFPVIRPDTEKTKIEAEIRQLDALVQGLNAENARLSEELRRGSVHRHVQQDLLLAEARARTTENERLQV